MSVWYWCSIYRLFCCLMVLWRSAVSIRLLKWWMVAFKICCGLFLMVIYLGFLCWFCIYLVLDVMCCFIYWFSLCGRLFIWIEGCFILMVVLMCSRRFLLLKLLIIVVIIGKKSCLRVWLWSVGRFVKSLIEIGMKLLVVMWLFVIWMSNVFLILFFKKCRSNVFILVSWNCS